ncbi:MAG: hydrolase [Chlamydiae bacterium CG10_big_fil_rev_8_21_14_0_10_35_9]|nr:MAG: hydrolase [Chlamydiae bacterium CG10_big_fil_rev_8_21_14_0_10_35_9]
MEKDTSSKETKKSFKERLAHNDLGLRLLVGFILFFCLGLFLHFREVRIEPLELNSIAKRYIVAQVDFEFPDEEATVIMKQESLKGIGSIYQIEEKQLRQTRLEFENFLVRDNSWKESLPDTSIDTMYNIADKFEDMLIASRFSDARTIQKMKTLNLSTEDYFIYTPTKTDIPTYLPQQYWYEIFEDASSKINNKQQLNYVVNFFSEREWSLTEDISSTRKLRKKITDTVPVRYTKIKAGSRIIGQTEKVTPRHLLMMQSMKKALNESRQLWAPLTLLSSFMLSFIFIGLSALYFKHNQPEIIYSLQKLSLMTCIVILTLVFAKVTEYIILKNPSDLIDTRYPLIIPFATMLVCNLLNSRTALFAACFLSIILSVTLAVDHDRFLIINLVTSLTVIITTGSLRKRKEVFGVFAKTYLSAIPVLFVFNFGENSLWNPALASDFLSSFIFMLTSAILVVGLLPILESLFHIMTDMTLMEFMDPNNELLQRLAIEVPGTYQHCLVLGNLAEAAAQAIGANGLFCRVACLYHDIGKLNNPHFFTENQQGGVNIHQLLTPQESAQVIISHVRDGEMLARKYRLPQPFIDIILQHHGTTLVFYFYAKEVELKGGKKEEVDEKLFRYPGPKPHSKESAIIMICDTLEAASRSLEETSEEALTEMVNRLVRERSEDGQFDECNLTFEELGIIKKTLIKTLSVSHHVRVKYPKKA